MINPKNPFNDLETKRQMRNNTSMQKKNLIDTKQGVLVNNNISNNSINDLTDDYIIFEEAGLPKDLFQSTNPQNDNKPQLKNPLLLLSAVTLGLLGGVAGTSKIAGKLAKSKIKIPTLNSLDELKELVQNKRLANTLKYFPRNNAENLPDIGRNMNLNKEEFFVSYMLIRNPEIKTMLATSAFFAFAVTGFVLKNFIDGVKNIWVKKQEASFEKNLQENMINVETRVFKGKNEIIRSMLSSTAANLQLISNKKKEMQKQQNFNSFLGRRASQTFGSSVEAEEKAQSEKSRFYPLIGAATIGLSVLFAVSSYKNIKKVDEILSKTNDNLLKNVQKLFDSSPKEELVKHKDDVEELISKFNFKAGYVDDLLKKMDYDDRTRSEIVEGVKKRTNRFSLTPSTLGGDVGYWQYYSYVDDAKGHFYNWMMNLGSKPLGVLSTVITAISGLGYVGRQSVEAIKEAEVKKANTNTELNLQKSLIQTELKNFYSKKQSYIEPLVEEIKKRVPEISDEEMQKMSENVLYEIKNGPPFVYS